MAVTLLEYLIDAVVPHSSRALEEQHISAINIKDLISIGAAVVNVDVGNAE